MAINKILILAANPLETARLRLDKEVEEIRTTLQLSPNRDRFVIESRGAVRPQDLQQHLYNLKPQILHFSGHGGGDLGLAFEDDDGSVQAVSTSALADLFKLFAKQIQCVVLNACYAVVQAEAICQHIPYVIGMNQQIGDQAARKFAEGFYRAIWDDRTIEDAFASGVNAIALEGIPEELTPVLLKRDNKVSKNTDSDIAEIHSNSQTQSSRVRQILAAIAFSDIVGFSSRMGKDELHTLELVERDFRQMTELCQKYTGKVLKTTGDGLLMYFTSAVQAVACAREIQTEFAEAASVLPVNDVLQHRIGIHLGDVFFSDTDVMGNGVNIAARLQAEADVGGICISQTVYDVVKNRLDLEIKALGELELKNIQEPISAYQILIVGLTRQNREEDRQASTQIKQANVLSTGNKGQINQQDYRDRQILLNKVRNFWIEGVLETSLYGKALIELGLQSRLDAIEHPWQMDWATPDDARKPLPTGTKAINQFDRLGIGRTLLILGDPGAGKTTTLLEITRELVVRAEQDSEQAIPIVFNLSSWQEKQTIGDWLVQELDTKYQVPKKIGKVWIDRQQLLLMLDGLDEVSVERRNACVEAINRFHTEFGQMEIIVCSRIRDYEALTQRLQFQGAIFIQPLDEEQVYQYFENLGAELEGVREMLTTDAKLMELAKTPLMSSVMAIAYRGMAVTELIQMSLDENHVQHLFDTYIERMLQRRPSKLYHPNKIKYWLSFLAKQLVKDSQTVFLIERMQSSWLASSSQTIYTISIGLILAPILALIFVPTSAAIFSQLIKSFPLDELARPFTQLGGEPPALTQLIGMTFNGIFDVDANIQGAWLIGFIVALLWGLTNICAKFINNRTNKNAFRPIGGLVFALTNIIFCGYPISNFPILNAPTPILGIVFVWIFFRKILSNPVWSLILSIANIIFCWLAFFVANTFDFGFSDREEILLSIWIAWLLSASVWMLVTISISQKFSNTARAVILTLANSILVGLATYSLRFDIWGTLAIATGNALLWVFISIFAHKLIANRVGSIIAAITNIIACTLIAYFMGFERGLIYSSLGYLGHICLALGISFMLVILMISPAFILNFLTRAAAIPIKSFVFAITSGILVLIFGLILGLSKLVWLYSLLAAIISLIAWNTFKQPIIPSETLKWSWENAKAKVVTGQIIGLVIGLIVGVVATMFDLGLFLPIFSVMEKTK